ncbi:MAG: tetratricopeptide repeat protein [candidate division Zixibacteria bacterium]
MYRKAILITFIVLVAASAIFALIDRKKVTTSSDKAYAAYLRGEEYSKKLYTAEAISEYERAVQLDPQFAMAYSRLGWLYMESGRDDEYKQARAKAFEFIVKVKDLERIQINLGFARADKNSDDIDNYFNELVEKFPNTLEAHELLAGKYWGEKNTDKAIEENLKVLEIDPQYALAYNMLGYLYYNKGEFDKALESINSYSEIAIDQANPHDSHGEILLWLGRYDEALRQFQIADSIKPNLDFVIGHMGQAYFSKGMYRDALGALFKAREIALSKGRKIDFELGIADCYIFSDRFDEAVGFLGEISESHPEAPSPHLRLGLVYAWQNQMDRALIELGIIKGISAKKEGNSKSDTTANSHVAHEISILEAEIAAARGDYEKAVELFKGIMEELERASRPFAFHRIGEILIKAQRPDDAIEILTEALKNNPNHPFTLITLAKAYGVSGQDEAKSEVLRRLLTVYKDSDDDFPPYKKALIEFEKLRQIS